MSSDTDYCVYCLQSTVNIKRTYIGCTNNRTRRIRQHNGEITGGARMTRSNRPWRYAFYASGLTKREALQLEWAMKHKRASGCSGLQGRLKTYSRLMKLERWCRKAPLLSKIRHRIKLCTKC